MNVFIAIGVALNVLGFLVYFACPYFTQGFPLLTFTGEFEYISFDTDIMNYMNFIKFFMVVALFIQVKDGFKIVNPLLAEYRKAQE